MEGPNSCKFYSSREIIGFIFQPYVRSVLQADENTTPSETKPLIPKVVKDHQKSSNAAVKFAKPISAHNVKFKPKASLVRV